MPALSLLATSMKLVRRSARRGALPGAALVALVASVSTARAQSATCTPGAGLTSCFVSSTVSATVPTITKLTISSTTADFGTIPSTAFDAADSTTQALTGTTLTIVSNKTWSLSVQAGADYFTGGAGTKASTDLAVSFNGSPYVRVPAASGAATNIVTGQPAGRVTGALDYQLVVHLSEAPDTYTLPVKVTITAP